MQISHSLVYSVLLSNELCCQNNYFVMIDVKDIEGQSHRKRMKNIRPPYFLTSFANFRRPTTSKLETDSYKMRQRTQTYLLWMTRKLFLLTTCNPIQNKLLEFNSSCGSHSKVLSSAVEIQLRSMIYGKAYCPYNTHLNYNIVVRENKIRDMNTLIGYRNYLSNRGTFKKVTPMKLKRRWMISKCWRGCLVSVGWILSRTLILCLQILYAPKWTNFLGTFELQNWQQVRPLIHNVRPKILFKRDGILVFQKNLNIKKKKKKKEKEREKNSW